MNILGNDELKEQQRLKSLELAINREKTKVDKKLTRQKIILGAFFIDALEKDEVQGLKEYTAKKLPEYLTRETDRKLLKGLVENLGGSISSNENREEQQQQQEQDRQQDNY